MVDFRYHLVSIIAIFMALALGIVIGTTQLNDQVLDDLDRRISGLTDDKRELEADVSTLRRDEQYLERLEETAVAGALTGETVVVLSAPNAPSELRDALIPRLEAAGAVVSGQLRLRPDLVDPTKTDALDGVVTAAAPRGLALEGSPVQRAAQELSAALVTDGEGAGLPAPAARGVLEAFEDADLVDVDEEPQGRATLAVLITGEPVGGEDEEGNRARIDALLEIARATDDTGGGVVVSGPLSGTDEGGALRVLREDDDLSERVSTADSAERVNGRLATVLALQEQAAGGAGQYGSGSGAERALPEPPGS